MLTCWLMNSYNVVRKTAIRMNNNHHHFIVSALSVFLPIVIPLLHFGVVFRLWDQYNYTVDKFNCRNSCWDTVFKGMERMYFSIILCSYRTLLYSKWYDYFTYTFFDISSILYFIGPYETGSSHGSRYKHVYFNANSTTFKLWIITVIGIIGLYEATKYVAYVIASGNLCLIYLDNKVQ
jgi:hypothetical protein